MRCLFLSLMLIACGKSPGMLMGGDGTGLEADTDLPPAPPDTDSPGTDTGDDFPDADADADADTDADADADADTDADDTSAPVIEGTGFTSGSIAYNLVATDQSGMPFALHDRLGSKMLVTVGNLDVATTAETLSNIQSIAAGHPDVTFMAFIGRDAASLPCNQACAADIQSTYGFSPVLWEAAAASPTFNDCAQGVNTRTYLINTEMEISWARNGTIIGGLVDDKLDDLD